MKQDEAAIRIMLAVVALWLLLVAVLLIAFDVDQSSLAPAEVEGFHS